MSGKEHFLYKSKKFIDEKLSFEKRIWLLFIHYFFRRDLREYFIHLRLK